MDDPTDWGPRRTANWSMELPGEVERFHKVGDNLLVVLKDGRSIDLSQMAANAKPSA